LAEPVVVLDGVVKRFTTGQRTVTALDGLTAALRPGQVTGLVGPDGAGKTTLMRLIAGIMRPDAGRLRVLGLDSVAEAAAIQTKLGYMPQRFGLYEDLTVSENLGLYADLHGVVGAARRQRFERLLHFTGLDPFQKRLAGRLSGGMKQKLGLACTLVHPPELLLLDEPSVGVDPVSRRELWEIVRALVGEGMSVLWSTAYLDEAERCGEVLLLSEGRLLDAGDPAVFTKRLAGRAIALKVPEGERRARLRAVRQRPGVIDAGIRGHDIRLLLAAGVAPDGFADLGETRVVEPNFEDAFIDLLGANAASPAPSGSVLAATPEVAPRDGGGDDAVISVSGLVRAFGDFRAVDGIDFSVRRGVIFGLLGPNGAGKSTTFKMLCGLLPPTDGRALVLGIDLRHAAAVARGRIGYMAQKFSLYGTMTVDQNVNFFASAYGLAGTAKRARTDWALDEFGLRAFSQVDAGDIPLGHKQRLALACAIMHQPGVLFLDEPTSGVDPLARREFWSRITAMAEAGVTIMVTTHFMDEAEYCDRIAIVYRGRLIATGSPDALKAEHATPERPSPTLDDAFVDLIASYDQGKAA